MKVADCNILRFTYMVIKLFIREYETGAKWLIFPFSHNNTNSHFGGRTSFLRSKFQFFSPKKQVPYVKDILLYLRSYYLS